MPGEGRVFMRKTLAPAALNADARISARFFRSNNFQFREYISGQQNEAVKFILQNGSELCPLSSMKPSRNH
jgi:hypothetical protein